MNFYLTTSKLLLLLPSFYLVYYVLNLLNTGSSSISALEEFKRVRNYYYLGYTIVFIVFGVLVVLRRQAEERSKEEFTKFLFPNLIVGLIISTFAYAMATAIYDLLEFSLFNLF